MIRKKIENENLRQHLTSLPDDGREVFLLEKDKLRITSVDATKMVNQVKANFDLGFIESYVLSQAYIAGALLTSTVKGNDRIQLSVECGGPIKGVHVEAWASGAVRGYLVNNPIPLDKPLESLDTSFLYGPGFLSVTKILEGAKTPFTGQIMLESGNLANDLALYFRQSEQTPTLFYLSVYFDRQGNITGAGGIFIQALPGCPEEALEKIENHAVKLPNMGKALSEGKTAREYVEENFSSFDLKHLQHFPLGFSCTCSKKGFKEYLKTLPQNEKDGILKGDFPLVLECFNCGSQYSFTKSEVETLFKE